MAHKKGVGSTDNGRDSNPNYLGVKLFGGQAAIAGNIIVRQRGTKFHAGDNVYMGRDHTLHAKVDGTVAFSKSRMNRTFVNILPVEGLEEELAAQRAAKSAARKANAAAKADAAQQEDTEVAVAEQPAPKKEKPAPAPKQEAKQEKPAPAPKQEEKSEEPMITAELVGKVDTKPEPMPDVPEMPAKSKKIILPSGKKITLDDLKVVEGIGPKIEGLLNSAGITSWRGLADADLDFVQGILDEAGPRYRMHSPGTWAQQAGLAADAKWGELEQLQGELDGGKVKEEEE